MRDVVSLHIIIIFQLIKRMGLQNRVIFTGMRYHKPFNYDQLNDVYDACEKLKLLYDNHELRAKYARVGRGKVEKYYGWDVVHPQWDALFARMLE